MFGGCNVLLAIGRRDFVVFGLRFASLRIQEFGACRVRVSGHRLHVVVTVAGHCCLGAASNNPSDGGKITINPACR